MYFILIRLFIETFYAINWKSCQLNLNELKDFSVSNSHNVNML